MRQEIQRSGGLINAKHDRTEVPLLSGLPLYHCCFFAMSLAGAVHHGAWFSFHLLHVVIGNETMQRTLRSVTKNGVTLLYVFYLLTVVIYMYSLFIFARYRRYMDRNDGGFCDTVYQCFVTSFRLGLLSGGGLGEAVQEDGYSFEAAAERSIFDISFFVLITTIGLNVVFGVIVDTFTELRDEKYNIEREKRTRCLICGLTSDEFERVGNSFKDHVRVEHNVWNYLYYFMYLHYRDPNDYSSLEQFIAIDIKSADGQYDFYPVGRALQFPAPQHTPLSLEETLEQTLVEDNLKRHADLTAQLAQLKAQHDEREILLADTLAAMGSKLDTLTSETTLDAEIETQSSQLGTLPSEASFRDSSDA
jgi:inositol 1,4,5-triphosphate receptor type 1